MSREHSPCTSRGVAKEYTCSGARREMISFIAWPISLYRTASASPSRVSEASQAAPSPDPAAVPLEMERNRSVAFANRLFIPSRRSLSFCVR